MPIVRTESATSGLAWYQFTGEPLSCGVGFRHAMVTRLGGISTGACAGLNLGSTVGDAPEAVAENHRRLFDALDIDPARVVSPHQVHGNHVACVGPDDCGHVIPGTDGLITASADVVLLLRFADCLPVLFYDPVHHVTALSHAGWRGTAAGVVPATVREMTGAFGTRTDDLWAGVGPGIDAANYEVGDEVIAAVQATLPTGADVAAKRNGRWHLDLPGAVAAQLRDLGIGHIELSGLSTAARTDEWYSHRAEEGQTGRFGALVMLS